MKTLLVTFIFLNLIYSRMGMAQTYQTCPMVASLDESGNPILSASGTPVLVPEPSCVAANKAIATSSGQSQANSFSLSGTTVAPPPAANCGAPGLPGYDSCIEEYNKQVAIYNANAAQNPNVETPLTAEQKELVDTSKNPTATGVLVQMIDANKEGKKVYTDTSNQALVAGVSQLALAGSCASTCTTSGTTGGCCAESTDYFATGAGFMLTSRQAETQATKHYDSGFSACEQKNKISSSELDCTGVMGVGPVSTTVTTTATTSQITVTLNTAGSSSPVVFNALTGTCSPPNSSACKKLVSQVGAPPLAVQQALKNVLKNTKIDTKTLYAFNKDGSISVNNGKSFAAKDFVSTAVLTAKGISASVAQKIITTLSAFAPTPIAKPESASVARYDSVVPVQSVKAVSQPTVASATVVVDVCQQLLMTFLDEEHLEPIGEKTNPIFVMIKCGYRREVNRNNFLVNSLGSN